MNFRFFKRTFLYLGQLVVKLFLVLYVYILYTYCTIYVTTAVINGNLPLIKMQDQKYKEG